MYNYIYYIILLYKNIIYNNLYIDHPGTKIHAHLFWTQKRSLVVQAARYCCPNGTPVLRQSTTRIGQIMANVRISI